MSGVRRGMSLDGVPATPEEVQPEGWYGYVDQMRLQQLEQETGRVFQVLLDGKNMTPVFLCGHDSEHWMRTTHAQNRLLTGSVRFVPMAQWSVENA